MCSLVEKLSFLFPDAYPPDFGVMGTPQYDANGDIISVDESIKNWKLSEPQPTQEELDAILDEDVTAALSINVTADRVETLWNTANKAIHDQISGGALSAVFAMAQGGDPNATLVNDWYQGEWVEYYRRRDLVVSGEEPDLDFSTRPKIPIPVRTLLGM